MQKRKVISLLGEWLEDKRKAMVVGRVAFCMWLGVSYPTYSKILKPKFDISPNTVRKVFARFGMEPENGLLAVRKFRTRKRKSNVR